VIKREGQSVRVRERERDKLITFIPCFKQSPSLKNYGSIVEVFMVRQNVKGKIRG